MFAKKALAFSGANFFSQAITFVQAVAIRWLFPPAVMGLWDFANVIKANMLAVNLGVLKGAERELPLKRGHSKNAEVNCIQGVALSYSFFEILFIAAVVGAYFAWGSAQPDPGKTYAVYFAIFLVVLCRGTEAFSIFLQGAQQFISISQFLLFSTALSAVAYIVGAYFGGLQGLFFVALLIEAIKVFWLWKLNTKHGIVVRFVWHTGVWKRLASFGARFRLTDSPLVFFLMIDLLWVARFMSISELAIYAAARNFFIQIPAFTGRIGTVYYTRLLGQLGQGVNKMILADELRRTVLTLTMIVVPILIWLVVSIAPSLISLLLPKYINSIPLLIVLVSASYFSPHSHNLYLIWHAQNILLPHGISSFCALVVTCIFLTLFWFVFQWRAGIYVAYAILGGYFFYFLIVTIMVGRKLWPWKSTLSLLIFVITSFIWTHLALNFLLPAPAAIPIDTLDGMLNAMRFAAFALLALLPIVLIGLKVSGTGHYLLCLWQKRVLAKI